MLTLELQNHTSNSIRVYSNEGAAQILFFQGRSPPETTYKSKNGKYQGQTELL